MIQCIYIYKIHSAVKYYIMWMVIKEDMRKFVEKKDLSIFHLDSLAKIQIKVWNILISTVPLQYFIRQ